jgi:ABC-type molybdate transport system substrate-binding protein
MYHLVPSIGFLAVAILPWSFGCIGGSVRNDPAEKVLVFAAASTTNAVEEICRDFEQEDGIRVRASFAATSTLAQQSGNGAEAHVLVSANSFGPKLLSRPPMNWTSSRGAK